MSRQTFLRFVAPSTILMLLLMVLPLFTSIWLSFHFITYRNLHDPQWIGLANYREVLTDPAFWESLRFTMLYMVTIVPAQIVLGFIVAMLLDQIEGRIRGVYIAASLLPFIVTPVVGALVFRHLFDPNGPCTYLLKTLFHYKLAMNSTTVRALIILHGIWYTTPWAMIVLFAGLQTLPQEPMEAATVDGANWIQKIWYVVLPHLRSLFVFISLISIMDAYRVFDSIYVLTKQNPLYKADTIMYYNFKMAMSYQDLGKANAIAILTVIGIMIILIPFLISTYRQQMEER
jgi:ABC-type sugar transport system permease subunit